MKAVFVLDCSIAASWCFLDEASPASKQLLERMCDEAALVPVLWFLELANVLALAEKKKRIDPSQVAEFTGLITSLDLEIDEEASRRAFTNLLPLCRTYQLTSYDAVYLDLALRSQLPLATLDQSLRKAAKNAGVKLLGK